MTGMPFASFGMIEGWAQAAIGRVVHSLPEGILIALFAWAVLRVLPKQNSGTRFAVWFTSLFGVVGLACISGSPIPHSKIAQNAILEWGTLGLFGRLESYQLPGVHFPSHWAGYLFVGWLVIAAVGLARLVLGLWHLRALRQSCTAVGPSELDAAVAATLDELNSARSVLTRQVRLAISERVRVPSALGLWKPVIALPAWALVELPADELNIVVRHEFAHLRRWDDWTNLAQKLVRAVFFFHPAVWWIESRLSVEREMACDDVVVAETRNPMGYASCLVNLLERSLAQRGWTMAQAIVHRAREASERVAQILDKNRPADRGISKPALGLVGTFAALCAVMLPATPQFVAFDGGARMSAPEQGYSLAMAHGVRPFAAGYREPLRPVVVAATLRTSATDAGRKNSAGAKLDSVVSHVSAQPTRANMGHPQTKEQNHVELPPAVETAEEQQPQAPTPRVVLVRETEIVTAEIPVPELTVIQLPRGPVVFWSVTMMRVTMRAPVWREMQVAPAKKI